jgi:predicted dehydrogenase/threonine dehydrogenase-like Zn-dependent dehydrogenase
MVDMKQVVQNYRSGELAVLDVPAPACQPGGVLVRSCYSLISTGTELMKVSEAKLSLLGKARSRPDQVRKVADTVAQVGPVEAYRKVMNRLDTYTPLGYSLCGIVTEIGARATEFSIGQVVACAGNEHALHAEVNWIPTNLCVPVPDGVEPRHAAFATVGAIAMQGVRRAELQLGEAACVIGLGLIGQLLVQLLVAAGINVVGVDPVPDRCDLARAAGASACGPPSATGIEALERSVAALSAGLGADAVFLAAGGSSDTLAHTAARLARDRGRVVDIGKCRLDLPWDEYYEKELDIRFSRSYGPGRYDPSYELDGIDYPPSYVRWTERRNLACFLDLLARNKIAPDLLVSAVFPVAQAAQVYKRLEARELNGVGFLFEYPPGKPTATLAEPMGENPPTDPGPVRSGGSVPPTAVRAVSGSPVRLGFLGAGNYASSMLLPYLSGADDVELAHVVTTTSLSAVNAQRRFGFRSASTDASDMLEDASIDAVFIVTRHHSHAELTCRALEHGKAVFVEKPLALSCGELDQILQVVADTGNDRLMVGFNRRFAPLLVDLHDRFGTGAGPTLARYLVNAGRLDPGSWYGRADVAGSRFEGEGGHFIDTLSWWLDARPVQVYAVGTPASDDAAVTIRFEGGSVGTIAYSVDGNPRYPKETFEAACEGRTARLDNFRKATVWAGRRHRQQRAMAGVDKGHRREMQCFLQALRSGGPMPIPLASLTATTRATLAASASLISGRPEPV